MQLNEMVAGNRFLRGLIIPGGVKYDVTDAMLDEIEDVLRGVQRTYADMVHIMWEQANFINRIRTTGHVRQETAFDLAMVGVGARASGMQRDSRKDIGYGIYDELDFEVVTETAGDVEARIKVRIGEVAQSLSLVRQLCSKLRRNAETERLFVRSASYPNWPALTVAVQGDIIPDFPLINKSFELCYACIDR